MSVALTVNGSTFNYPNTNDTAWGYEATGWAVAVTAATLPKAGGAFTLTGPVNFGSAAGLLAKSFSSNTGANVAVSGVLNLTATDVIAWRNASNTGDNTLGVNGSNQLIFNGTALLSGSQLTTKGDLLGYSTQPVRVPVGSNGQVLTADSTQADGLSYSTINPGAGITVSYASGSFTVGNSGVLSYSFNDTSTTPIYTVTPTSATTGAVAATMVLNSQTHGRFFAGPVASGSAQPTFRVLDDTDFAGTDVVLSKRANTPTLTSYSSPTPQLMMSYTPYQPGGAGTYTPTKSVFQIKLLATCVGVTGQTTEFFVCVGGLANVLASITLNSVSSSGNPIPFDFEAYVTTSPSAGDYYSTSITILNGDVTGLTANPVTVNAVQYNTTSLYTGDIQLWVSCSNNPPIIAVKAGFITQVI